MTYITDDHTLYGNIEKILPTLVTNGLLLISIATLYAGIYDYVFVL